MKQPWTTEEIAFIEQRWETMDDAELADAIRRPMSSVAAKRLDLGFKRRRRGGDARRYCYGSTA